jgi:hypothetical protein
MSEFQGIQNKVREYEKVRRNVQLYRARWTEHLRQFIIDTLEAMTKATGLAATIDTRDNIGNLEAVALSLGKSASGIFTRVDEDTNKPLIKDMGALVYQQLFNGKVQTFVVLPYIEGFGQPPAPTTLGIYRPDEITLPFIERHMEEFLRNVIDWEDFDDDKPSPIGFHQPPALMAPLPEKDEDAADADF